MAWGKLSRQARGYGPEWDRAKKLAFDRDQKLCVHCAREGRTTIYHSVDHIVPKAKAKKMGWSEERQNHISNLQCLCEPCHKKKTKEENGATYKPKLTYGLDGWPIEEK